MKRKPFFESRDTFLVQTTDRVSFGGYMATADSETNELAMMMGSEVVHVETSVGKHPRVLTFGSSNKLRKNGRTNMKFCERGKELILPVYVRKIGKKPLPTDSTS